MKNISLEEQLELYDSSPVVIYTCKPHGDFAATFISPGISAQLGWEASDFLNDPSFWASHIHPADKERVFAGLSNLFEKDRYSHEYRFQHKDGSYRWMNDDLRLDRDEAGDPVKMVGHWTDITARHRAEQALIESETRYRQLAELSPDGMLVHVDGEIVFANASMARILTVPSPSELLGKQAIEFVAPEYHDSIAQFRADIMKREVAELEVSEFMPLNGSRIPVERTGAQISWEGKSAILVIVRDISNRAEVERALRESEGRFKGVVENLPASLTLKDLEGRFQFVNRRFMEWFDLQPEDVIGRTTYDVFPNYDHELATSLDRKVMETGQTQEIDRDVPLADGTLHSLALTKFPVMGPDDNIVGVGTINSDITERKQAEEALRQAQKMEAVGQLTGGVAHDFNNLLAVVMGNLELAADQLQVGTPAFDFVGKAFTAADRGASLTQHLLAFARQQVLQPEEIDLARLIGETKDLMSVSMGEKITMGLHTGDNLWRCKVDQAQLQNAILNLSINARDAMPSGGEVTISAENITLDAERAEALELDAGDYVCLSVSDSGPGIPEDVLYRAFEPFFTTKDVGEGSGLGLSMVYGFVQQSGGSVDIETGEGEGTSVKLYFPAIVPDEATVAEVSAEIQVQKFETDATILLVEDNAAFREVTRTILENLNFRVIDFGTAEEALTVIGDTTPFDLLLSDIGLPGQFDGHDLAEYAASARPGLKIVLMSAHADRGASGGVFDNNVAAFLRKPHHRADLTKTLHRVLELGT